MMEKLNFDELQPSAFEAIVGGADNDYQVQGLLGLFTCCNDHFILNPDRDTEGGQEEGKEPGK